ncbi:MAG: TonB-dependent receptor [Acidobacteria bacterium]|nr:TonB-dependent receptor [Acidobacteriota bacterium]
MLTLPRVLGLALCVLACAAGVRAQTFQGGIRGSVRDVDGVVPAAEVTLTEDATGLTRTTVTNERGEYVFANLLPGAYRVRAAASGFKTHERGGLTVGTQTFLTLDITLEVGRITEEVRVEAPAPLIERSNASVSTLLDRTALQSLPSAGRNVFITATQTPTVLATGDAQFVRQQDQSGSSLISMGGSARRHNTYVLDGVPIVDIQNRATFIPSFQALEEMRVQVGPYDAEVGRTSGGVFNTTARAGTNVWRGSAMYQNRPDGGQSRLFFARKADIQPSDTYYHLYGGWVGGPLLRDRTFFSASTEGYRTATTRNTVLRLPTEAERRGDFSQSSITIYDPLTTRPDPSDPTRFIRDPFPGNRIPQERLNPVSLALLQYLPLPTDGKSRPAVADIVDAADQLTGKITHLWNDSLTTSGLYAWYGSAEPDARFYGRPLFENGADPGDGALIRRVHLVGLNNLWTPGPQTAVAVRYGYNRFLDDNRPAPFDLGQLPFDPAFTRLVPLAKFPNIGVAEYGRGGSFLGDRSQDRAVFYAHNASVSVSRLVGTHTWRFGGDSRVTGVRFHNIGGSGGFNFDRLFTFGPNPNSPAPSTGDAFASFLLGHPSGGGITLGAPIDVYLRYWSGFVQDDVRVTPRLTLNLGLRYEFEDGLRERDNRMVVGWGFDEPFPIQVGGTRPDGTPLALTGGTIYAGVDGAPTRQGDPNPWQFAPRAGIAYTIDDRTVVRGGYGLFWAPAQGISPSESASGTRGFIQSTSYVATLGNPFVPCDGCSLTNPFPGGLDQPRGSSTGRLTGVGGYIDFIDPRSRMGHVHRFSVDWQRELPHQMAVTVGYLGARGEKLGPGGSSGSFMALNQLDPKYFALGTALQEPVANPFFGTPLGVGILAGPNVPRGQFLRPYPQFDGVFMLRSNLAKSRYHALVATGERRLRDGWALRANYTWSRTKDCLFGESNFFAGGSGILDYYDVDAEYGLSVLDTPHVWNVTGLVELPLGLTLSAVGRYQSGFPVSVLQSPNNTGLLGSGQRPNVVPGVDSRLTDDPADSYDPACGCIRWLNPAAWSLAGPFAFGNAPRADGRARTPARHFWDVAVEKSHRVLGTTLAVRAEIINLFNAADFRGPNIGFGDATFGQIREAAGFPRMLQLVARVAW